MLLGLLLLTAALGLCAVLAMRRGPSRVALAVAITGCAIAGVWIDAARRMASAARAARHREEVRRFMTPPPVMIAPSDPVGVTVRYRIPCEALTAKSRAEVCAADRRAPLETLSADVQREIRGDMQLDLGPSLHYVARDAAVQKAASVERSGAGALFVMIRNVQANCTSDRDRQPSRLSVDSATVHFTLPSSACVTQRCEARELVLLIREQWFCATDFRIQPHDGHVFAHMERCRAASLHSTSAIQ